MFSVPRSESEARAPLETLPKKHEVEYLSALLNIEFEKLGDDLDSLFGEGGGEGGSLPLPVAAAVAEEKVVAASSSLDKLNKQVERELTQQNPRKKVKIEKTPEQELIAQWEAQWTKDGRNGSIGLVPQALQRHFPDKYTEAKLTEREHSLLTHFIKWKAQ